MSSPVLWGPGNIATNLESGIQFSGSAGPSVQTGILNPSVTALTAVAGSLYLNSATSVIYKKNDNGLTTNWLVLAVSTNIFAPTVQTFISGSGTYVTPGNVSYIRVRMVGGGGGGAGSGTGGSAGVAGTGGTTTLGTSLLSAGGGYGAVYYSSNSAQASGSITAPALGTVFFGGVASSGLYQTANAPGMSGASSAFGGAGGGGAPGISTGLAASINTGSGGGGASTSGTVASTGAGGNAGAYIDAIIASPSASYSYSVGASGLAGAAGTSGSSGGAGGSGYIEVTEYYVAPSQAVTAVNDDVGAIVTSASSTAPGGTLLADGTAVSRATYPALFAKIGTTFGVGDGSTTFNIPNLQGVFLRGAGSQTISGIVSSATLGATQGDQMQGHVHVETVANNFAAYDQSGGGSQHSIGDGFAGNLGSGFLKTQGPISDGTNGTPRTGTETRPANVGVQYFIRYSPSTGLGTIAGGGISRSIQSVSTNTTAPAVVSTDYVYFVSGTTTLTLPTAVGTTNKYTIKNTGVATVTLATTSAQTIDGSSTASLPTANTSLDLISDGANWRIV